MMEDDEAVWCRRWRMGDGWEMMTVKSGGWGVGMMI